MYHHLPQVVDGFLNGRYLVRQSVLKLLLEILAHTAICNRYFRTRPGEMRSLLDNIARHAIRDGHLDRFTVRARRLARVARAKPITSSSLQSASSAWVAATRRAPARATIAGGPSSLASHQHPVDRSAMAGFGWATRALRRSTSDARCLQPRPLIPNAHVVSRTHVSPLTCDLAPGLL